MNKSVTMSYTRMTVDDEKKKGIRKHVYNRRKDNQVTGTRSYTTRKFQSHS